MITQELHEKLADAGRRLYPRMRERFAEQATFDFPRATPEQVANLVEMKMADWYSDRAHRAWKTKNSRKAALEAEGLVNATL